MMTYLKVTFLIVFFMVSMGFVLPFLFSAASTELVVAGFVYVVLMIPFMFYIGKNILKGLQDETS